MHGYIARLLERAECLEEAKEKDKDKVRSKLEETSWGILCQLANIRHYCGDDWRWIDELAKEVKASRDTRTEEAPKWISDPATDKQIASLIAKGWGGDTSTLTKGQASQLIATYKKNEDKVERLQAEAEKIGGGVYAKSCLYTADQIEQDMFGDYDD